MGISHVYTHVCMHASNAYMSVYTRELYVCVCVHACVRTYACYGSSSSSNSSSSSSNNISNNSTTTTTTIITATTAVCMHACMYACMHPRTHAVSFQPCMVISPIASSIQWCMRGDCVDLSFLGRTILNVCLVVAYHGDALRCSVLIYRRVVPYWAVLILLAFACMLGYALPRWRLEM